MSNNILLELNNVVKYFPIYGGVLRREVARVHAVRDISFKVKRGETVGLVGESGCGKSTLGRTIVRLYDLNFGEILFDDQNIMSFKGKKLKDFRKKAQMIFQDPYASLNPRMTVRKIVGEPFAIHRICKGKEREERILKVLELVGLKKDSINRYPHEFSGGQRQRIGIARALAVEPEFIVCDEPVSALDVSIQAQVINLLSDLKDEFKLTYLFISHDIKVVNHICDRIIVMYLGKIMEIIDSDKIFESSKHPYTKALISAVPIEDPSQRKQRIVLEGDVPSPIVPPSGCPFHPRCFLREDICISREPKLRTIDEEEHLAACHYAEKVN